MKTSFVVNCKHETVDFFFQFKERGPYVYQERETKIDVKFSLNTVQFYFWYRQIFDEKTTQALCGKECNKCDMVRTF